MKKLMMIIVLAGSLAVSAEAIDDDLAGGFARIVAFDDDLAGGMSGFYSRLYAGPFGDFWKEWWGNATASFGQFTPIPKRSGSNQGGLPGKFGPKNQ